MNHSKPLQGNPANHPRAYPCLAVLGERAWQCQRILDFSTQPHLHEPQAKNAGNNPYANAEFLGLVAPPMHEGYAKALMAWHKPKATAKLDSQAAEGIPSTRTGFK